MRECHLSAAGGYIEEAERRIELFECGKVDERENIRFYLTAAQQRIKWAKEKNPLRLAGTVWC